MTKPTDPIFATAHNATLRALGAVGTGNTWGMFDVLKPDAIRDGARLFVVPLWNYHDLGTDGRPDVTSKGLLRDPCDGTLWYKFRDCFPGEIDGKLTAQWDSLRRCHRDGVPVIGVLKDRASGLCALDLTFDGGSIIGTFDDAYVWMQLHPREGVDLELVDRHTMKAPETIRAARLTQQGTELEESGYFDPNTLVDARARTLREVVQRSGQPAFKRALLAAYGRRCAITGCDADEALEAAHIIGYLGPATNHVTNGLLLRADIHTLFDLGLVAVCPDTLRVALAPSLRTSSYSALEGQALALPAAPAHRPDREALRTRWTAPELFPATP